MIKFQENGLPFKTRAQIVDGLRLCIERVARSGPHPSGYYAVTCSVSPDLLAQAIRELESAMAKSHD